MKELTVMFKNNEEAKYYCRCLSVEHERVFNKNKDKEAILIYTDKYSFLAKLLIKLGLKKIEIKRAKIHFRSKNTSDCFANGITVLNDVEISDLYRLILKECRKNG